jgi:hypothetical protein
MKLTFWHFIPKTWDFKNALGRPLKDNIESWEGTKVAVVRESHKLFFESQGKI